MDDHSALLPLHPDDELDLQVGRGLIAVMAEAGFRKIAELRSSLAADGKRLPLVRVRDNQHLASFRFLLHDSGQLKADGDFATLADILQSLSGSARQSVVDR